MPAILDDLPLFEATGVSLEGREWIWHVTGRYLVVTEFGWPKPKAKRVVWHFQDSRAFPTEAQARAYFTETCGKPTKHNQWVMWKGEEIKPLRKGKR
jgi:hypothetical protein